MKGLFTWLYRHRFPYKPLITVEISKTRLLHNLHQFKTKAPNTNIAPVLKSNAYGHGLVEVARILQKESDIPFFIIDSYFEALVLRRANIHTPLLIIGYVQLDVICNSRLSNIIYTVTSIDLLRAITETKKPIKIHLKIDTGMHRQGILPEEVAEAVYILKQYKNIDLQGICTHLSDSDNTDSSYTKKQIAKWNTIVDKFTKVFPSLKYIHASATYGHSFSKEIRATISRLGIGLYGLTETENSLSSLNLLPVMEMKTMITGIKKIPKGESVGYNNTYTAAKDMRIATIPVGYYEGVDRRLSNTGYILVGKSRIACPIVGRVSMNITTIDVSAVSDIHLEDEVIIISKNPKDLNSISSMVQQLPGVISYEMVVSIPNHLKRVVV